MFVFRNLNSVCAVDVHLLFYRRYKYREKHWMIKATLRFAERETKVDSHMYVGGRVPHEESLDRLLFRFFLLAQHIPRA